MLRYIRRARFDPDSDVRRATTQPTSRVRTIHLRRGDWDAHMKVRSIPHRRVQVVWRELEKHTSREGNGYIPRACFMRYSVGVGVYIGVLHLHAMGDGTGVRSARRLLVLYQYRIRINLNIMIVRNFCLCSSVAGMGVLFLTQGKWTYWVTPSMGFTLSLDI